ncbi:MAG: hypothetical protein AAGB48_04675 [Planctomycetota bacterium]
MATVPWVIAAIVVFDVVVVVAIVRGVSFSTFKPLAKAYPPVDPIPGAKVRKCQSFSFGLINLGFSVRVTLDEACVHLAAEPWARWIGLRPVSIPRDRIEATGSRRSPLIGHTLRIETGTRVPITARGPRWLWEAVSEAAT